MHYGIIADEATDSSTIEHISLCVRYFEKKIKTVCMMQTKQQERPLQINSLRNLIKSG